MTQSIIGRALQPNTIPRAAAATSLCASGAIHGRAIRGVADRLLALACTLLQRQTVFDPDFGTPEVT